MLKYIISLLTIVLLVRCDTQEAPKNTSLKENYSINMDGINSFSIDSDQSDILISKNINADKIELTINNKDLIPDFCDVSVKLKNKELNFSNKKINQGLKLGNCEVSFNITFPKDMDKIDVNLGAGKINIKDVGTDLNIKAGTVNLVSNAPLKSLKVNAGNFEGNVSDMKGDASFAFGSGKIAVIYNTLKETRSLAFKAGYIDSIITLPADKKIEFDQSNSLNSMKIINKKELKHQKPDLKIKLNTASGQVKIKEIKKEKE